MSGEHEINDEGKEQSLLLAGYRRRDVLYVVKRRERYILTLGRPGAS